MDVVLLCRVSTAGQDYSRQVDELSDFCSKMGWNVRRIFTAKVSGAKKIEERSELTEMLDYIRENSIDKVCVLEISRLGRNTLEALKVIRLLNDNGVCLYIKNYNLETLGADGKPNPIASMICTILLEVAQMERLTIMERMASGRDRYIAKCRAEGIKMGRPGTYRKSDERMRTQYTKELGLLKKGISLRNISAITGTSVGTIRKLYKYL
ncbi:MAG: recombinase family protein [Candidatus Cryptobacteroides sp.]|jgi:DNA invertase Pin-like site-specific DNA recombinase|nr:recombinase family protein [Candidatus Cryptobacteroides sp.]